MALAIPSAGGSAVPAPSRLEGRWISDCLAIGQNGRHGIITRIAVDGDRIATVSQIYATTACETPTFQMRYRGRLLDVRPEKERLLFEHRVEAITLTPQAEEVVAIYNHPDRPGSGCGLDGWRVGVAQSVAGRSCAPYSFAAVGARIYDAAWIEGEGVRFGAFPAHWTATSWDEVPGQPLPAAYRRVTD